jgi:hypothetical protein
VRVAWHANAAGVCSCAWFEFDCDEFNVEVAGGGRLAVDFEYLAGLPRAFGNDQLPCRVVWLPPVAVRQRSVLLLGLYRMDTLAGPRPVAA